MANVKKETKKATIELPQIDLQMMDVTVVGDTPLIVHAWSKKARTEMLDKQLKKAKGARAAKDPVQDFEESMYRFPDGGYGFPSVGFKSSAVTAVTSVGGLTKVAARQAFQIVGEGVDVAGAFEGTQARVNLARIEGAPPAMREDMVRINNSVADLRYRAEFWPWCATLLVRFNANVLSPAQILNILNVAGFAVGVGEWRPEKDGESGMFHVAQEGEAERLMASVAPAKRAA